jgi:hypothetical protein
MCLNETYNEVCVGKHFSDSFTIQNDLKQLCALSLLLFNFALEYTIREAQENQVGLMLNETPRLLAFDDDENLLGNNIDTISKNTDALNDANKNVSLEIKVEKMKYM